MKSPLTRWDPFAELNTLHEQVNSLFNDTFGGIGSGNQLAAVTDVYSNDKELSIETHLPNFKEEEIQVEQHDNELEIKAEHEEKDESKDRNYLLRESVSRYYRRFSLPKNCDAEQIQAKFENGVLRVTVPYKELPAPKRIAIGTGAKAKK